MLTKFASKNTDATRRAAMQLAIQLPEEVSEARAVLEQVVELLEGFLIRAPRELWNKSMDVDLRGARMAHGCALLWTTAILAVLTPISVAAAAAAQADIAGGFVMFSGVVLCALVLGQLYGVVFSVMAATVQNVLLVPPVYQITAPTRVELIRLIGFVTLAVMLPVIANKARWIRELALKAGGWLSRPSVGAAEPPATDQPAVRRLSPDK